MEGAEINAAGVGAVPNPQEEVIFEAQNGLDRYELHKDVIGMFPDLDLTTMIQDYGHMTPEGFASIVVENMAQIPKRRGTKRKASDVVPESPESVSADSTITEDIEDDPGDLLVDKLLAELLQTIKSEQRKHKSVQNRGYNDVPRRFLSDQFMGVRSEFIMRMLRLFYGDVFSTAIACFFSENNFASRLQKISPNWDQKFWCKGAAPLCSKRNKKFGGNVPENIQAEFTRYIELMHKHRMGEYISLITNDLKLTEHYNQIKWERSEPEKKLECIVCFEHFPINRMLFCTPTTLQGNCFADQPNSQIIEKGEDKPGSSQPDQQQTVWKAFHWELAEEKKVLSLPQTGTELSVANPGNEDDPHTHGFCRHCVRGQAQAATEEQPLADGGVGLRCMVPECSNPILYSEIRLLLTREVRKKLDERILEENIGMASLSNLERCKRCNFAIEMEVDKYVNKVFDCLSCGAKFCRFCERDWDDDHFGISCEELDVKLKKDKKERNLEKQLNEAVIRKCPRCGIAFMKDEGCNKMTCRCGMTQCYLCRESKIDYTHYCQHFRDPKVQNWKCTNCTKKCFLYEDAKKRDDQLLEDIRVQEAADALEQEAEVQGPSTSNAATANQQPPAHPRARRHRGGRFDGQNIFAEGAFLFGADVHRPAHPPPPLPPYPANATPPQLPPFPATPPPLPMDQRIRQLEQFFAAQNRMPYQQQQPFHAGPGQQAIPLPPPPPHPMGQPQNGPQPQQHRQVGAVASPPPPNRRQQLQYQQHLQMQNANYQQQYFAQPFVGYFLNGTPLGGNNGFAGQALPPNQMPQPHFTPPRNGGQQHVNIGPNAPPIPLPPPPPHNGVLRAPLPPPPPNPLDMLDQHFNQIINQVAAVNNANQPDVIDLELDEILDMVAAPMQMPQQQQFVGQQQGQGPANGAR